MNWLSLPEDIVRLSADTISYGVGKGAEALAALVLLPVLTRAFTPEKYGIWDVVMTFFLLTTMVASLALEPALAACYFESEEFERRKTVASTSIHFRFVSSIVVAVSTFLFAPWISLIVFNTTVHAEYFRIIGCVIPFFMTMSIFKQLLRVHFAPGKYNIIAIGYASIYVVLGIVFVVFLKMGVAGILLGMLGAAVCFFGTGAILTRPLFSFEVSFLQLRNLLAFGVPLVPSLVAYWVIDFSDRYFLTKLSTLEHVGIYSVGAKVSSIIVLFVTSFQMAWGPTALSAQYQDDAKERYARGLLFFLALGFVIATGLVAFGRILLMVLTPPKYYEAERVIGPLVLASVTYGAFLIVNIGLMITRKTHLTSIAIVSGALVNLMLNFILIPKFQIMGAAVATVVAYLAAFGLLYAFAQRHYPVDYNIYRVLKLALLSIGTMAVASQISFEAILVDTAVRTSLFLGYAALLWRIIRHSGN